MECAEFRERIGADPAVVDDLRTQHERACPACAAYARRLRSSERLIAAALRFDIASVRGRGTPAPAKRWTRWTPVWALAASVSAAVVAVWLGMRLVPSHDPLRIADAVEQHWYHEPESWLRTALPASATALDAALGDIARVDLDRLSVVTYARSCLVNGHWVPHLVVQGDAGPVMLLLMRRETLAEELPLDLPREHLRGVIVPLGDGSIAILGDDDESLERLRRDVPLAVEWAT